VHYIRSFTVTEGIFKKNLLWITGARFLQAGYSSRCPIVEALKGNGLSTGCKEKEAFFLWTCFKERRQLYAERI